MTSMTKKETDARRVAVIGAGAAGMMAAITAAEAGADVTLFERNDRVGKKLRITGKGRCNVTNNCDNNEFLTNVPTNVCVVVGVFVIFARCGYGCAVVGTIPN